jgi:ribosomal protein S18 acetylase RimI-like enzyme
VAEFHVAVWWRTYGDIAPPEALAALGVERRLTGWQERLQGPGTWMAEDDAGTLLGLVSFGAPSDPVFGGRGEVKHLYVAEAARRQGLGERLLRLGWDRLAEAGFPGMGLAVVRQNAAALAFYGALGGREAGAFTDPGPLWRSDNLALVWDRAPRRA